MLYDGLWPILNRRTSNEKKDTFSVMFSCTFFNFVKRIVCVEFTNIQTLKSSVNVEFWASSKAVDCSRDLFLVSSRVSFSISVKCWINLEWWSFRIKCNFLLCCTHLHSCYRQLQLTCEKSKRSHLVTYRNFCDVVRFFFLHFNSKLKFPETICYLGEEMICF